MSRVNTNNTSLRYTIESSVGVLPGSPLWRVLEFQNLTAYGATITTVPRRPISQNRGRKKGSVVDLDSSVEFESDLTIQAFGEFAEGFAFAQFANKEFDLRSGTGTLPPPAVTDGYTIDAASALLAGKVQFTAVQYATLAYAQGYATAANNGLKAITTDLATSGTTLATAGQGVVAETPPTNASLQVCGVRVLNDTDLTLTVSGSTATLVSAAAISNWATLGLFPGMFIHIGSKNPTTGAVQNALGAGGTVSFGYARIVSISGATINLDKIDANMSTASGPASGNQDVLFGRFLRNVAVGSASTDLEYLERTYQFEASYPDLDGVGTPVYEYAIGNYANELQLNLQTADKATATWGFIGTNSDALTTSRKTGASSAVSPLRTTAVNCASDVAVLSSDVVSSITDVIFKDLTLTINNNVSPEKGIGRLGAYFVNSGLFEVNLEGQMIFTRKEIVNAIRNNTTVTFHTVLKNDDGAIAVDLPTLTLGGGEREFPLDASVLVNLEGNTFTSPTLGYDVGISMLVGVPSVRP